MKRIALIVVLCVIAAGLSVAILRLAGKGKDIDKLVNLAKSQEQAKEYLLAKESYQKLIQDYPNQRQVADWQRRSDEMNIRVILSPLIVAGSKEYEIKPGDTLTKIAREFNTTVDLIMKSNNLSGSNIQPGKKIKVQTMPFSVVVDKSQNVLTLKAGDEVSRTYVVSTGVNNSSPVGTFKIVNKLVNPTWFKTGAVIPPGSQENILGSRWMGFDLAGYGIHGTTEPQNLGKQVTQGCVRMANPDVEELYILLPVGTEVTIID